jgi:hypothetical protein
MDPFCPSGQVRGQALPNTVDKFPENSLSASAVRIAEFVNSPDKYDF